MLKGCQKRIVFLKDTGSELFDEAYFVIKAEYQNKSEGEFIQEATKIANSGKAEASVAKRSSFAFGFFLFSIGLFIGTLLSTCAFFLFS